MKLRYKALLVAILLVGCKWTTTNSVAEKRINHYAGEMSLLNFGCFLSSEETLLETNKVITTKFEAGSFETKWIIETNSSANPHKMFADANKGLIRLLTNSSWLLTGQSITNYGYGYRPCEKEHLDKSQQTDTSYVSSNLVAILVWRGITNIQYLESFPVITIVHHWHWDKKRVEED